MDNKTTFDTYIRQYVRDKTELSHIKRYVRQDKQEIEFLNYCVIQCPELVIDYHRPEKS